MFDWEKAEDQETAALRSKGETEIQGLISYLIFKDHVDVHLAEASPFNRGSLENVQVLVDICLRLLVKSAYDLEKMVM